MIKKCKNSSPDFLIIGAGRSGTTWLYENLKKYDNIWLPPVKEIHYFDRSTKYPSPSLLYTKKLYKRLLGSEYYNKDFRRKMLKNITSNILTFNIKDLLWCFKYFFGEYNDDWYVSLFNTTKKKITGDITPAYQLLDLIDVAKVYQLLPNTKIIFIIRNPIDRTWSQLRKNKQNMLPHEQITKILKSHDMRLRNNYLYTIKNWRRFYSKNQFMLCFFDDIINNPDKLLIKLLFFVSGGKITFKINLQRKLKKFKVNAAPNADLTSELKLLIINELYHDLKIISEECGGYAVKWFKEADEYRKSQKVV